MKDEQLVNVCICWLFLSFICKNQYIFASFKPIVVPVCFIKIVDFHICLESLGQTGFAVVFSNV